MKNAKQAIRLMAVATTVALSACGGGGGSGGGAAPAGPGSPNGAKSGEIQGPVSGLRYITSSGLDGEVGASGGYHYRQGDTIDFLVGDTKLASVMGRNYTSLVHLIQDAFSSEGALKIRYLVSIDADGNLNNGIQLDNSVNNVDTNDFLDWSNEADVQALLNDTGGEDEILIEEDVAMVDFQKMEILTSRGSAANDIAPGSYHAIEIINYGYAEGCSAGFSDADLNVTSMEPLNVSLSLNNGDSFLLDSSVYAMGSDDPEFTSPADVLYESGQAYFVSRAKLANGITGLGLAVGDFGRGRIMEANNNLIISPASLIEVSDAEGCTFRLLFNTKGADSKGLYAFRFGLAMQSTGSTELAICGDNSSSENQLYMPIGNYSLAAFGGDVKVEGMHRNNVTGVETSETFDCREQLPERVVKGNPSGYCLIGFDNIASCQDKLQAEQAGIPLDYARVTISVGGEQVIEYVEGRETSLHGGEVGMDESDIVEIPSGGGTVSGYIFDSTLESNRFSFTPTVTDDYCGSANADALEVSAWLCDDRACQSAVGGFDGDPFIEELMEGETYYMYVDPNNEISADAFDPIPITLTVNQSCPE